MDPQKCSRSPLLSEHFWLSCALCLSSAARQNKRFVGSWERASLLRATTSRVCLELRCAPSELPPRNVNCGRDGVVNPTYEKGGPNSTLCEKVHKDNRRPATGWLSAQVTAVDVTKADSCNQETPPVEKPAGSWDLSSGVVPRGATRTLRMLVGWAAFRDLVHCVA
jgi:hypothetical protein